MKDKVEDFYRDGLISDYEYLQLCILLSISDSVYDIKQIYGWG